jgi:hypothetical protein
VRLPTHKVYRAFPELDRFSDEACERYVAAARGRAGCLLPGVLIAAGVLAAHAALLAVAVLIIKVVHPLLPVSASAHLGDFILSAGLGLTGGASMVFGFKARNVLLRRTLRDLIRLARCPGCEYSLLGLQVREGRVRCPECGRDSDVRAELGLTEEQLLAGEIEGEKD